jgi:hypothetical protein
MRRIKALGLMLVAVLAMSVAAATAAQGAEGPIWITKNGVLPKKITSTNTTVFKLKGSVATVECSKTSSVSGEIENQTEAGTKLGTDKATILFTGCIVNEKATCHATGAGKAKESGEIETSVKTILVYPDKKSGTAEEALDAFFPGTAGSNQFAEFTLEGAGCGFFLNKQIVKVTATGTEVNEPTYPYKNKCGVLAEVGKLVAGAFAKTKSTEKVTEGALKFPEPAITKAELYQPKTKNFKAIECKLEAGFLGAAEEIGTTKVETEPAEEFGWEV